MDKNKRKRSGSHKLIRKIHSWSGIVALWWLGILGITGVFLNHPQWRWQHQLVIPSLTTPENRKNGQHLVHPREWTPHIAISHTDANQLLSGGRGGLWISTDAGRIWHPVDFQGIDETPQVFALLSGASDNLDGVIIATDDGVWRTSNNGRTASPIALSGEHVSSIKREPGGRSFLAVLDYSAIVRIVTGNETTIEPLQANKSEVAGLSTTVSLNRWVFDLHLGTGFLPIPVSLLISDIAGVAMFVLAVTGFFYWLLPRRWRKTQKKPSIAGRRSMLSWLFRGHVVVAGLIAIVPLLYLSITGIFLGHKSWFQSWSQNIPIQQAAIPGDYNLLPFDGEIESIGVREYDGERVITLLTRMGMLQSIDDGETWSVDSAFPFDIAHSWNKIKYFQYDSIEVLSDVIGRNYVRYRGSATWQSVDNVPGFHVMAMSKDIDRYFIHTVTGVFVGEFAGQFKPTAVSIPELPGLDLAYLFRVIHGVLVFNFVLVWFNDAMGVLSLLLIITGLIYWLGRARKWS